jgi:hypothetical protein
VNRYDAMAETHGDLVSGMGGMLDPISRIVDRLLHFRCDLVSFDADAPSCLAILPRPTPHVFEHLPMQLDQEVAIENISSARIGPAEGGADIDLFCFV